MLPEMLRETAIMRCGRLLYNALRTKAQILFCKELNVTVIVSSRHMDVSAPLKTYAEQKVGKLTRYYDRIQEIEVVFDAGKDTMRVEVIVNAEHRNMFIAHHDGS